MKERKLVVDLPLFGGVGLAICIEQQSRQPPASCTFNHYLLKNGRTELMFLSPLQNLLSLGYYRKRVQYLKGTPLDYVDLERAGAHSAHCILVIVSSASVVDQQAEVTS